MQIHLNGNDITNREQLQAILLLVSSYPPSARAKAQKRHWTWHQERLQLQCQDQGQRPLYQL